MPERRPAPPPAECANCGTAIPRTARACPECGADERTGWRENADTLYDGLDLPEEAFEDEGTPSDAHRKKPAARVNGVAWYWWCVGVALLAALLVSALNLG